MMDRRRFLQQSGIAALAASCWSCVPAGDETGAAASETGNASALSRVGITTVGLRSRFPSTRDMNVGTDPGPADLTLETVPRFVADELGLNNLELWYHHFDELSIAYCERIRAAAERAGVQIINVQAGVTNPSDVDPDVRAQGVTEAKAWIDRAVALGSPRIRINTGGGDDPFDVERTAASFREMTTYGQEHGVMMMVENHGGYSQDIDNVVAILDAVNSPNCRALADYGNTPAGSTADRLAGLEKLFPYLEFVSAKGTGFNESYEHTDYDFGALVRATEQSGYTGPYSIEMWPDADSEPPPDPVRAALWMKETILENLEPGASSAAAPPVTTAREAVYAARSNHHNAPSQLRGAATSNT